MNWRDHSRLTGKHALLGASNYHWLNYDADRLTNAVLNYQAKERGTRLHAFAAECIDLKQKLPKNLFNTKELTKEFYLVTRKIAKRLKWK